MGKAQELENKLTELRRENEMLRNFSDASKDALFCIEYIEPVDLTAPKPEIIRQVFENECVWRMCNAAMAQLYKLPKGLDFNAQNVHFVFPRNPKNEEFVQTLIEANFNIDSVISLDGVYDGRELYMENDVRGVIEDGMLLHMTGAVRNIAQQKSREKALTDKLNAMSDVLSAIPDPILVINSEGILQAANPALEWSFGINIDHVLGRSIDGLITFPSGFSLWDDASVFREEGPRLSVGLKNASGRDYRCEAHISSFHDSNNERRIVITLRGEKTQPVRVVSKQRGNSQPNKFSQRGGV